MLCNFNVKLRTSLWYNCLLRLFICTKRIIFFVNIETTCPSSGLETLPIGIHLTMLTLTYFTSAPTSRLSDGSLNTTIGENTFIFCPYWRNKAVIFFTWHLSLQFSCFQRKKFKTMVYEKKIT